MSALFDSLPGLTLPVAEVSPMLRTMWDSMMGDRGDAAPSEFRASQLNLILHFGLQTTPEEARANFETAVAFAQRYPCRVIVLCPQEEVTGEIAMTGKLFSQCYMGPQLRELCCCEALILSYAVDDADFLLNQVSLWIESDLPVYHWFHRVPGDKIEAHYREFLLQARRVVFDATHDPMGCQAVDWPEPQRVRNLAHARTLPLRQNIGQFLSGFPPSDIVTDLERVEVLYDAAFEAEVGPLRDWLAGCIRDASEVAPRNPAPVTLEAASLPLESTLNIFFHYKTKKKNFAWAYRAATKSACVGCNLGGSDVGQPFHVEPMPPENALAEALFF